jgi:hypothetical protein
MICVEPHVRSPASLIFRIATWITCAAILFVIGNAGYYFYQSHLAGPTTKMENSRLPAGNIFHAFDNLTLYFETTRLPPSADCILHVTRYVKKTDINPSRVGDQDHVIQQVDQTIKPNEADSVQRRSQYTANLGGDLPPGNYVVWSYVRYECNWVDWFVRHELITDKVPFVIIPDDVEIPPHVKESR